MTPRRQGIRGMRTFTGIVQHMNMEPDEELDRLAHEVIGAAIEVHRILGPGFLESVYEEALIVELGLRTISVQRQVPIPLVYKGVAIGQGRLDLPVQGKLIVEIKTVEALAPIHKAQTISYLKATGLQLALLINFNAAVLKDGIKRIVRS
jgi:GxxExxY protein